MGNAEVIRILYDKGIIKLNTFTLKSGVVTPLQVDLRQAIAYPQIMQTITQMMWDKVKHVANNIDVLGGIAETTLPFANHLTSQIKKNTLTIRKGNKAYGKKWVEGQFRLGEACLMVEEAVTTGTSVLATIGHIRQAGLQVPYVLTFLEREHGVRKALNNIDCELFSVFTQSELLQGLKACGVEISDKVAA